MKLLLHCCCGPCAAGALPLFREAGFDITGFFYNPNIHPYTEQQARLDSFKRLMEREGLPYIVNDDYPLEGWLRQAAAEPHKRCGLCYDDRLTATASLAASGDGFDAFSTTLLISPYQDHETLRFLGEEMEKGYGVKFAYLDLRPRFRAGQREARALGLYMQKYCGCIYSEKERYLGRPDPPGQSQT